MARNINDPDIAITVGLDGEEFVAQGMRELQQEVDKLLQKKQRLRAAAQEQTAAFTASAKAARDYRLDIMAMHDALEIVSTVLRTVYRGVGLVTSAMGELITRGQKMAPVGQGFERLAGGTDKASVALEAMQRATKGLITDQDLMLSANKAMLLGVTRSADGLADMAETAVVLGRAMGLTAAKSIDDLTIALGRSSPRILDNLGLTIKVHDANERYAASIGKTVKQLSDYDKQQAFITEALRIAKERVDELGGVILSVGDEVVIFQNRWENTTNALAVGIAQSPVLAAGLHAVNDALAAAFSGENAGRIDTIVSYIETFAIGLIRAGEVALVFGDLSIRAFSALAIPALESLNAVLQLVTGFGRAKMTMMEFAASTSSVVETALRPQIIETSRSLVEWEKWAATVTSAKDAAYENAQGMGAWNKTLQDGTWALEEIAQKMEAKVGAEKVAIQVGAQAKVVEDAVTESVETQSKALAQNKAAWEKLLAGSRVDGAVPAMKDMIDLTHDLTRETEVWLTWTTLVRDAYTGLQHDLPDVDWLANPLKRAAAEAKQFAQLVKEVQVGLADEMQFDKDKAFGRTITDEMRMNGKQAGEGWSDSFADAIQGALRGGGSVLESAFGSLFGSIGKRLSGYLSEQLAAGFGNSFTRILSGVLPGGLGALGGLVGRGLSALGSKLFKTEGRKVNDLRDEFIATAGGLDALNRRAREAGTTLDALLRADTVREYNAAVADLNQSFAHHNDLLEQQADLQQQMTALQQQLEPGWDDVSAAMDRYGISLESAGQAIQQLAMTDAWQSMLNDIDLLERAGIDVGSMLAGMSDEISGLVQQSLEFGTTIPSNMRPWIEELQRSGGLVDENGRKIEDLAGINWGEPLKSEGEILREGLQAIVDKLDEIAQRLGGLSGTTLDPIRIPVEYDDPGFSAREVTIPVQYVPDTAFVPDQAALYANGGIVYAAGGYTAPFTPRGTDTVPAMLTPGELVVSRADVQSAGGPEAARRRVKGEGAGVYIDRLVVQASSQGEGREAAAAFDRALRNRGIRLARG